MIGLLITLALTRWIERASTQALACAFFVLAAASALAPLWMDAIDSAHLDHLLGLGQETMAQLLCVGLAQSTPCVATVHWVLTPVGVALKPVLYGALALLGRVVEWC